MINSHRPVAMERVRARVNVWHCPTVWAVVARMMAEHRASWATRRWTARATISRWHWTPAIERHEQCDTSDQPHRRQRDRRRRVTQSSIIDQSMPISFRNMFTYSTVSRNQRVQVRAPVQYCSIDCRLQQQSRYESRFGARSLLCARAGCRRHAQWHEDRVFVVDDIWRSRRITRGCLHRSHIHGCIVVCATNQDNNNGRWQASGNDVCTIIDLAQIIDLCRLLLLYIYDADAFDYYLSLLLLLLLLLLGGTWCIYKISLSNLNNLI